MREMKKIKQIVTHYPLSVLCIIMVWILSLTPFFPETPLDNVALIDKWTHTVMYGGLACTIWGEYFSNHQHVDWEKLAFWGWLAPILMSGMLELIQEYCTMGHRNGDWLDFAANAIGASLGATVGLLVKYSWIKAQ